MQIEDERKGSEGKIGAFFKRLGKIKNIQIIAVIFIIAIGLIIYSTVMTSRQSKTEDVQVMTSEEQRLGAILGNIDGAGKVEVMITSDKDVVKGVLIIADGADNITVRLRLLDAAATALGVDRQIVNVFSRK